MWIVIFYIVTSTGQWNHGACFDLDAPNQYDVHTPDGYVYYLNNYHYEGSFEERGQTTFTWLPCDPNTPLKEQELGVQ